MKFIKYLLFSVLLLVTLACEKSTTASSERFAANFSFSTCVRHAGDVNTLTELLKKRGIKQLSESIAANFLSGNSGKAWSITSPDGQFAIAYRNDGVCTLFIKKVDANSYIAEANLNLDRIAKNVGWSFSPNKIPNFAGESSLKSFTIIGQSKNNKKVNITLSTTHSTTGNYQVALSSNVL